MPPSLAAAAAPGSPADSALAALQALAPAGHHIRRSVLAIVSCGRHRQAGPWLLLAVLAAHTAVPASGRRALPPRGITGACWPVVANRWPSHCGGGGGKLTPAAPVRAAAGGPTCSLRPSTPWTRPATISPPPPPAGGAPLWVPHGLFAPPPPPSPPPKPPPPPPPPPRGTWKPGLVEGKAGPCLRRVQRESGVGAVSGLQGFTGHKYTDAAL
jgi:hypothetical protein